MSVKNPSHHSLDFEETRGCEQYLVDSTGEWDCWGECSRN